jgi:hypothetical protein
MELLWLAMHGHGENILRGTVAIPKHALHASTQVELVSPPRILLYDLEGA